MTSQDLIHLVTHLSSRVEGQDIANGDAPFVHVVSKVRQQNPTDKTSNEARRFDRNPVQEQARHLHMLSQRRVRRVLVHSNPPIKQTPPVTA